MNLNIRKVKIFVTGPEQNLEDIRNAMCNAGAGIIANYSFCSTSTKCVGTFIPNDNAKPYIGSPNQRIIISNTKFDPVCLRIEICENDFDTLATSIDGNQIRALDNGLLTTYNKDNEIYKQWEFYTLKDNYNRNVRYEVKRERTDSIDNTADAEEIFEQ